LKLIWRVYLLSHDGPPYLPDICSFEKLLSTQKYGSYFILGINIALQSISLADIAFIEISFVVVDGVQHFPSYD
jgi:hypothetical protein